MVFDWQQFSSMVARMFRVVYTVRGHPQMLFVLVLLYGCSGLLGKCNNPKSSPSQVHSTKAGGHTLT